MKQIAIFHQDVLIANVPCANFVGSMRTFLTGIPYAVREAMIEWSRDEAGPNLYDGYRWEVK